MVVVQLEVARIVCAALLSLAIYSLGKLIASKLAAKCENKEKFQVIFFIILAVVSAIGLFGHFKFKQHYKSKKASMTIISQ